ncbi:MAG: hypothetical protein QXJ96_02305 [Candidatus Aenigmatarchaeota archaeon]|nr:hypothetical protein [Candidatus Aenigmarchaeota archaeon]
MKLLLDSKIIRYMKLYQTIFHDHILDCAENENYIYFVIEENENPKEKLEKIRALENLLKKKVKIIRFKNDIKDFIRELVPELLDISIENNIVKIGVRKYDKPKVLGKNKSTLRIIERFLKRFFNIEEVKIV